MVIGRPTVSVCFEAANKGGMAWNRSPLQAVFIVHGSSPERAV